MQYKFMINDFEGPLDLLLHLVKEAKMDIYEINTSEIIDQYLNIIHGMEDLNIENASEYLVMASELVHLKSKLLLNIHDEEDEEEYSINSEEDLKRKLADYEKYKIISEEFRDLEEKRSEVYTKYPEPLALYRDENFKLSGDISLNDLLQAFLNFQARNELAKPLRTKIARREISVEERKQSIRKILKQKKKVNFLELFEEVTKEYVIVTFLSILEMSKQREISLTQDKNFSEIYVEMS